MFSFLKRKKDPLHEELKRAKRIRKLKDRIWRRRLTEEYKTEKRIKTFIDNNICPDCGRRVKLEQTVDETGTTDNHYTCTGINCSFGKHYLCDDEDFEW